MSPAGRAHVPCRPLVISVSSSIFFRYFYIFVLPAVFALFFSSPSLSFSLFVFIPVLWDSWRLQITCFQRSDGRLYLKWDQYRTGGTESTQLTSSSRFIHTAMFTLWSQRLQLDFEPFLPLYSSSSPTRLCRHFNYISATKDMEDK